MALFVSMYFEESIRWNLLYLHYIMKLVNYVLLILCFSTIISCTSIKETVYFQDKKGDKTHPSVNIQKNEIPKHIITVGDFISINISTPLQSSVSILGSTSGGSNVQVKGDSTVDIPIIGSIRLAGLSFLKAKDTLLSATNIYYKQPIINLHLVSFKVTVLGEVKNPGVKALNSENSNVLDALATSGDLTDFGDRKNIKIIRGDKIHYLNLIDINILKSEGFYLQSDDIIYIQPLSRKAWTTNLSTTLSITGLVSIFLSVSNTVILLLKK